MSLNECLMSTLSKANKFVDLPRFINPNGAPLEFPRYSSTPCALWTTVTRRSEGSKTTWNCMTLHPRKLTWTLKITQLKRTKLSSKPAFLGSMLVFTGCKHYDVNYQPMFCQTLPIQLQLFCFILLQTLHVYVTPKIKQQKTTHPHLHSSPPSKSGLGSSAIRIPTTWYKPDHNVRIIERCRDRWCLTA